MTCTADQFSAYSDCYKSLYNVRPHRAPTDAELARFWASYDEDFALMQAQDAADLAATGYPTWAAYDAALDTAYEADREADAIARAEAEAHRQAYFTRNHPLPVIEAWEAGAL